MTPSLGPLAPYLDEFLLRCEAENLSPKTIAWYRERLSAVLRFALAHGVTDLADLTPAVIRAYVVATQQRGRKPATLNASLRSLRAFCRYFLDEGDLATSPMARIKLVKEPKLLKPSLTPAELDRLLATPPKGTFVGQRDRAILRFLLDTGVRATELCQLTLEDVHIDERWVRVYGKGRKERIVPLGRTVARDLLRFLRARQRFVDGAACPYLFPSIRKRALTPNGLAQLVRKWARAAGFDTAISPHLFRHTFARVMVVNGVDPFSLQDILGHSDIRVTRGYVGLDQRQLQQQHDRFGPLDHWPPGLE